MSKNVYKSSVVGYLKSVRILNVFLTVFCTEMEREVKPSLQLLVFPLVYEVFPINCVLTHSAHGYVSHEVCFNERELISHGWVQFFTSAACDDKCQNLTKSPCTTLPLSLLNFFLFKEHSQ